MKRLVVMLLMLVTMFVMTASPASAHLSFHWSNGNAIDNRCTSNTLKVKLHEHTNYGGNYAMVCGDMHDLREFSWSDTTSSLNVVNLPSGTSANWWVTLYKHVEYGGSPYYRTRQDQPNLHNYGMGDVTTSVGYDLIGI